MDHLTVIWTFGFDISPLGDAGRAKDMVATIWLTQFLILQGLPADGTKLILQRHPK